MIQQVFKIIPRQRDLHPTKEMWVGESYESREAKIIAANGSVPHANMKFVREVTFEIKKSITINDLRRMLLTCFLTGMITSSTSVSIFMSLIRWP